MLKLFFLLTLLLNTLSVFADSVKWKDVSFSVDIPENWREVKDFYGIPVTLLGPSVSPKPRAVVQIIPTEAPAVKIKDDDAKSFGEKYAEGRKRWVAEQNGTVLEILPGKLDGKFLTSGVSYKINKKSYLERTFYTSCPKRLFHLKIVLNFENESELAECEKIVRSFSCDG